MNKRSRKVRGSSRRLVALALCCVCVLAALPVYALASEAGTTPSTEANQASAPVATDILPATGPVTQGKEEPSTPAGGTSNDSTPAGGTSNDSTPADVTPSGSTPATDTTPSGTTQVTGETSNGTTQVTGETSSGTTPATDTTPSGSTQEPTQPVAPAKRTVTTSADGLEFSVTGNLTDTTTLRVEKLDTTAAAYIRDTVLNLGDQVTGAAYDITLCDNGEEIQPKEAVEVSIAGLASAQGVYHLPHTSAEDVRELVEDMMDMADGGGKLGKAITQAVKSLAGKDIPSHEKLTIRHDQGKLKFKTSGFSTYYVVFDKFVDENGNNNDVGVINGLGDTHNDDYVYMAPGTATKYKADHGRISGLTIPEGAPFTVEQQDDGTLIFRANADAEDSNQGYVVTWKEGNNTNCQLTIYVNGETALQNNLTNEKLYIAVRGDGDYPGEPADNSNDRANGQIVYSYYTNGGNGYAANTYANTVFSDNAAAYISGDIIKHENFRQSINDTPAVGIVDQSGAAIRQFITGNINFGDFLDKIANRGNVTAVDGTVITNQNKDQYELVPYVIKYQGNNGPGWHIDCIVRQKAAVTLSYDLNIPTGYTAPQTVVAPNNQSGTSPSTFDVGVIKNGTADVGTITVKPTAANPDEQAEYTFTFKGWNTKPDGTGAWYYPGGMTGMPEGGNTQITITEDTTLYAMWDTNPQLGRGNLKITKVVTGATTQQEFEFQVNITLPEGSEDTTATQYTYTVYSAENISQGTGQIKSGEKLNLKAGQYAVINNLPSGATVTITETNAGGYTPSWTGGTATQNGGTSVTIQGGITSQVTCTNIAAAKLTIKKTLSGNMYNENDKFDFSVTINEGTPATFKLGNNGEKEITVPVGASVTITENPGSYTYSLTSVTPQTLTTTPVTDGNGLSFTMPGEDVTVVIDNKNEQNISTGVLLDTLPYLLILALVGGGVVLMLGRRRRRYED